MKMILFIKYCPLILGISHQTFFVVLLIYLSQQLSIWINVLKIQKEQGSRLFLPLLILFIHLRH